MPATRSPAAGKCPYHHSRSQRNRRRDLAALIRVAWKPQIRISDVKRLHQMSWCTSIDLLNKLSSNLLHSWKLAIMITICLPRLLLPTIDMVSQQVREDTRPISTTKLAAFSPRRSSLLTTTPSMATGSFGDKSNHRNHKTPSPPSGPWIGGFPALSSSGAVLGGQRPLPR